MLVGLIQTVLYGKTMPLSTTAVYDGAPYDGAPSTYDAAQSFTLTSLKAAAAGAGALAVWGRWRAAEAWAR